MTAAASGQIWDDGTGRRVRVIRAPVPTDGIYPDGARVAVETVTTRRKSAVLVDRRGMIRRYFRVGTCDICQGTPSPTYTPCCSSHGKVLCCRCYRLSHFVETGCGCCPDGRETRARHGLSAVEASTG